jgi:hypothetical protein
MTNNWNLRTLAAYALLGGVLVLHLLGCATGGESPARAASVSSKGAAQLWAENCNRCHNSRPPGEFSDAQWQVIVHHMRVRAGLTAEESRQILAFLKASN